MGANTSNANIPVHNDMNDSETIRRNIVRAFQDKKVNNRTNNTETLNWNSYTEPQCLKQQLPTNYSVGGGRRRYEKYNPDILLSKIMNGGSAVQNGGTMPQGLESSSYKELSDDVLQIFQRQVLKQTSVAQSGAGCGCDGVPMSVTSPQPVDYRVLVGGATNDNADDDDDDDDDEEDEKDSAKSPAPVGKASKITIDKSKIKIKGKTTGDLSNNENDAEEDDDDAEIDIDDDEEFESEDEEDEEDEDMDGMERQRGNRSQKRGQSDDMSTSAGLASIIKPFYSSDSDYYNIKKRSGRFN